MLAPNQGTCSLVTRVLAAVLATGAVSACSSDPLPTRGLERADRVVGAQRPRTPPRADDGSRPPALLNGEPITWSELRPILAEAAGAEALQEVAIDR
ncbi:MAG: hypothetical protein AAGK04_12195, partial [Planctomycetota bacterium]